MAAAHPSELSGPQYRHSCPGPEPARPQGSQVPDHPVPLSPSSGSAAVHTVSPQAPQCLAVALYHQLSIPPVSRLVTHPTAESEGQSLQK
ncbi:hypothetical protein FKM82_027155 [Ascaphus truei]